MLIMVGPPYRGYDGFETLFQSIGLSMPMAMTIGIDCLKVNKIQNAISAGFQLTLVWNLD